MDSRKILEVKNLKVSFNTYAGTAQAVRGVDFHLNMGETLAIVGESGCGKTVTAKAIMGLLPKPQSIIHKEDSEINFFHKNLLKLNEREMEQIRGKQISMIFQDPMTSLNPTMKIGNQIAESMMIHNNMSMKEAKKHALRMLELVRIPNAKERLNQYPFEFSGGMRQRAMIAIALACNPKILIADEPTTALDVTIQAQIMDLIGDLQKELNTGVILVTHDLGVVASVADRIQVMYAGKIVERGTTDHIFYNHKHPYTYALLRSVPKLSAYNKETLYSLTGTPPDSINPPKGCPFAARCEFAMKICSVKYPDTVYFENEHECSCWLHNPQADTTGLPKHCYKGVRRVQDKEVLIQVKNLKKYFKVGRKATLKAVDDVNFNIYRGETLGLVGESGCGKTTCGKTILGLYNSTAGEVIFEGIDIHKLNLKEKKEFTKKAQIIFQDPYSSLNPRMTVGDIIGEGIDIHKLYKGKERQDKIFELLDIVGLNREHISRFPHEFSGGQRQRIGIARALAIEPDFIVCDEPISALDVSIQAQIVNLLIDLQKKKNLTYLFIAHDLSMIKHISDRVGVMYLGNLVEITTSDELYKNPLHPYTKALLSAIPIPDPHEEKEKKRIPIEGEIPSPMNPIPGCKFASRCKEAKEICTREMPPLIEISNEHFVACHGVKRN